MFIRDKTLDPEFSKINRILVRGVNWVGDTILTFPSVQGVKELFPHSRLTVLVPNHLVDLWKTFPCVDEIIPFKKKSGIGSIWEDVQVSRSMKKRKFDLAIIFPRSFRSAFQIYLAGIPIRIGYQDEGRSPFLTHEIERKGEVLRLHRVHYYRRLMEPLGHLGSIPSPRLFLGEEEREWAKKKLDELGLLDGRPIIGINPGAAYGLAKCWPPDRFAELGERLSNKWKATALIFGREEERGMAERILKNLGGGGVDFTGKTRLLQLAALLERCCLLVTNDTGTMHMASAVGTPVVAIFGSTDPVATGPWGDGHVVVKRDVPCSPCLKRVCPTDHRCMELISVDEVEEVVSKKLEGRQ
ncbi:MAG: lipopolysaccharide heptosyltransferase II [Deltaproteobacteria bacterium]|nr:lipopolysaccharide heptosyltransferase II [Deltaproteobacteria bacterium]